MPQTLDRLRVVELPFCRGLVMHTATSQVDIIPRHAAGMVAIGEWTMPPPPAYLCKCIFAGHSTQRTGMLSIVDYMRFNTCSPHVQCLDVAAQKRACSKRTRTTARCSLFIVKIQTLPIISTSPPVQRNKLLGSGTVTVITKTLPRITLRIAAGMVGIGPYQQLRVLSCPGKLLLSRAAVFHLSNAPQADAGLIAAYECRMLMHDLCE